jgi:hypothetical protein
MNTQKTGFGFLLPALMNPATATVLAVGVVGYGLLKLLSDEEKDEDKPSMNRSTENREPKNPAIQSRIAHRVKPNKPEQVPPELAVERIDTTAVIKPNTTIAEPFNHQTTERETDRSELIRQYMSELGKRSAVARAKKRELTRGLQVVPSTEMIE